MAAFGENNYGSPFGAIDPTRFFNASGAGYYDYSGFSSRSGASGFSGTIANSGFCGPNGLTFLPYSPTLTFPLNFEVLQGVVAITWKEASPPSPCNNGVVYELQFTRTFTNGSGWKTIATDMPVGTSSFQFDFSEIPYTDDAGFRIRARDSMGLFSPWSDSNQPSMVANHAPNPVTLLSPVGNDAVDSCLPVVWREAAVKDVDGQAVTYLVEMTSSYSLGTGWAAIPGATALPEGTVSFNVSCFDFPDGPDYGVRVSAVDSLGLGSIPRVTGPIKVKHQGNIFIDTLPPDGTIAINGGQALAAGKTVNLTLSAWDASTGVKDVRFRNADEGEDCWSGWDSYETSKIWDLTGTDGVKTVMVQFRDYANNVSSACNCEIVGKVLQDTGNCTAIEVFNNSLYAAFDANGNLTQYKVLVNKAATLPEPEVTALARLGNYLYVGTYNPVATTSSFYKFAGVATRLFSGITAKINSMVSYGTSVYLGLADGRILTYANGGLTTSHAAGIGILRLTTDGAVLFATLETGGNYLMFDGTTWVVKSL